MSDLLSAASDGNPPLPYAAITTILTYTAPAEFTAVTGSAGQGVFIIVI
jgi:hypothetical protein